MEVPSPQRFRATTIFSRRRPYSPIPLHLSSPSRQYGPAAAPFLVGAANRHLWWRSVEQATSPSLAGLLKLTAPRTIKYTGASTSTNKGATDEVAALVLDPGYCHTRAGFA